MRGSRSVMWLVTVGGLLGLSMPVWACPSCAAGQQARSQVWNDGFGMNLFISLLPFLLIGAICLGVERLDRVRTSLK